MFLVGLLDWWYGRGWRSQVVRVRDRLSATLDFFSMGQLASTLFAPFRQISAGRVDGPIGVQLRAFLDKTFSRFIGAFVRLMTIFAGLIIVTIQSVIGVIVLLFWFLLPLFPIIGFILFAIGWAPRWM